MLFQSVERLISPTPIHHRQAIAIALVGLAVNLVCAWLLRGDHPHHDHPHEHHHAHGHDAPRRPRARSSRGPEPPRRVRPRAGRCGDVGPGDRCADGRHVVGRGTGSMRPWASSARCWSPAWARGLLRGQPARCCWTRRWTRRWSGKSTRSSPEVHGPPSSAICTCGGIGRGKYACIVALVTAGDAQPSDFKRAAGHPRGTGSHQRGDQPGPALLRLRGPEGVDRMNGTRVRPQNGPNLDAKHRRASKRAQSRRKAQAGLRPGEHLQQRVGPFWGLTLRAGVAKGTGRCCAACPGASLGCATRLPQRPWPPRRGRHSFCQHPQCPPPLRRFQRPFRTGTVSIGVE